MSNDSGTLDSSKNYLRMEPQTIRLKALTSINNFTSMYARGGEIRMVENAYLLLLLISANDVFFIQEKLIRLFFGFGLIFYHWYKARVYKHVFFACNVTSRYFAGGNMSLFFCFFWRDFERGSSTKKCGFLSKALISAFF